MPAPADLNEWAAHMISLSKLINAEKFLSIESK